LEAHYRPYLDRFADLEQRLAADLFNGSAQAAAMPGASFEQAALLAQCIAGCTEVERRLEAHDDDFFDVVELALSDSQRETMPRVRSLRARVAARTDRTWHPACAIDLVRLYIELVSGGLAALPDDPVALDELLIGYDQRLTQLVLELRRRANWAESERGFTLIPSRETGSVTPEQTARAFLLQA